MHVFLETERLILRRFTAADIDHLVELDSDPAVMGVLSDGAATPRAVIERDHLPAYLDYYQRYAGYGFWAAIETGTGDFLGWFHLRPYNGAPVEEPELGYRLRRAAWGKGYATEGARALLRKGFTELGVQRVVAFTAADHRASWRVMEKAGMRLVRTYRLTPEQWASLGVTDPALMVGDDVEYAITKDEWDHQAAAAAATGS